ncbi:MAG: RidA family protein, partial [Chloroflexi bacterium]|nr:RidA family protein [Chloroflexota bacterium]
RGIGHAVLAYYTKDEILIDVADYAAYGKVRSETFGSGPPASSTVMVAALVRPEFLVEVEAIVHVPGGS